jgi:Rrf2 family protein
VKLSSQVDYAVRTVYDLACREPGAVVQTREIADSQRLTEGYLAKVIQNLARAGLLHTVRGSQGGVSLARPAAQISVREVFEAVDGPLELHRCRHQPDPCGDVACGTHGFWERSPMAARTRRRASCQHVDEEVTTMKEEVEKALQDVRPALQADGGDIELVDVTEDGVVQVRLQGHCAGCPMSQMTLTHGVERHLKNVVPGVARVENVA